MENMTFSSMKDKQGSIQTQVVILNVDPTKDIVDRQGKPRQVAHCKVRDDDGTEGYLSLWDREIPLAELYSLLAELTYQKQLEQYQQQAGFAAMIATMVNLWGKEKIEPMDLIGQPPKRAANIRKEVQIWSLAEQAGIRTPKDKS